MTPVDSTENIARRDLTIALLRSATEAMALSDIWRGLQNHDIQIGYNEFEDWLLDQTDLVQVTRDGRILLKAGVDTSRVRRTRVIPDSCGVENDVTTSSQLQRLVRYYIDCLKESGKLINPYRYQQNSSFVTLDQELYSSGKNFATVRTSQFGDFVKNASGNKRAAYYGYPLILSWVDTGDGEFADYKIIPIFITRLEIQEDPERCIFHLIPNTMRLNPLILKSARWKDRSYVSSKLDANPQMYSSFMERLAMVPSVLQDVEVKEELEPTSICRASDLAILGPNKSGIYNRCGFFLGGSDPYIQGLVRDMEQIKEVSAQHFEQTALPALVRSATENADLAANSDKKVLVLSPSQNDEILNAPQEDAVKQAFTHPFSVVTGPPGTGKSQVVIAIITTAVLHGKSVLFASRNNKALEIVQERLKKICPDRHTLIRVGGEYDKDCIALLDRIANLPAREEGVSFHRQMEIVDLHNNEIVRLEKIIDDVAKRLTAANLAEERFDLLKKKFLAGRDDAYEIVKTLDAGAILNLAKRLERLLFRAEKEPNFLTRISLRWQRDAGVQEISILQQELRKSHIELELSWPLNLEDLHKTIKSLFPLVDLIKAASTMTTSAKKLGVADQLNNIFEEIATHKREIAGKVPELLLAKVIQNAIGRDLPEKTQDALLQYRDTMPKLQGSRLNDEQRSRRLDVIGHLFPDVLLRLPAWAVTNLSVSHRIPLKPGLFDLVIIDEASQCDIPSCFPLLYRAKQAVIIGDPLQLPQITQISTSLEEQLLRQHGLDGPENDHLRYSEKSMYDAARRMTPRSGYQFLSSHYRCHPDIIRFANSTHWYEDRLDVFTETKTLKRPDFWKRGIEWVQVSSKESSESSKGYYLRDEVDRAVDIVQDLLEKQKYEGTVGVVCPFTGMTDLIRDGVDKRVHASLIQASCFEAKTAHGFQGDERDVIIYAMAVHPEMPRGSKWFIAENSNLFNVALSRARAAFVVVGDKDAVRNFMFEGRPVTYLRDFVDYVENLGAENPVSNKEPSFTHDQLWEEKFYLQALKPAKIPVVSQYALGPYKLDFALIRTGKTRKLDIEIDGEANHKDSSGRRLQRDVDRNIYVKAQDGGQWDVMRFWVYELKEDMESCLKKIQQWMNSAI